MTKWEIIITVVLALNGFWMFTIACMLANIGRHTQEQAEAIVILIATMLNNKSGGKENETTDTKGT